MEARRELPRTIKIATGFLILNSLGPVLLMGLWLSRLPLMYPDDRSVILFPSLAALAAWLCFDLASVIGLLRRRRWGWTSAVVLMGASTALVGLPLAIDLIREGIPSSLSPGVMISLGGLANFGTPLLLLIAGRQEFASPRPPADL